MAEALPPLYANLQEVYDFADLGRPLRDLVREGVVQAGGMLVTQRAAGANRSVDVAAGTAWILGDGAFDDRPAYRVRAAGVVNLAIAAPDATNPRIDLIVAQAYDSAFVGALDQWERRVIAGTPAATPAAPAVPDTAIALAQVLVPVGSASVVSADITDRRAFATITPHARVARVATQNISNATLTTITLDTEFADTDRMWSVSAPTTVITRTPGVYLITANLVWAANVEGDRRLDLVVAGTTRETVQLRAAAADTRLSVSTGIVCATDATISMQAHQSSGGTLASTATLTATRIGA